VVLAGSGIEGLKVARRRRPDLVILDVIMPGMDGYAVCREMRSDPILNTVPVLFLTAKVKDEDKIAGFMAGADDYLVKPFNIDELILRIRAVLRRAQAETKRITATQQVQPVLQNERAEEAYKPYPDNLIPPELRSKVEVDGYVLDTRSYELTTPSGIRMRLTPVQFDLLLHMMRHPGEIFSPIRLLDEVWDYPSDTGSPDLVRVHIKNLRERIEIDPRTPTFIRTVPGYGYTIGSPEVS
jgi:DNA-binding response OmpR family regulator